MKLRKRVILTVVLIAFVGNVLPHTFIVETQAPKSAATIITYWYTENDAEKPGVLALIAEFESANPTIDVSAFQISFFDARNMYMNAFEAGTEPSVFRPTRDWIPEFAAEEMIQPLTSTFVQEDYDDYLEIALEMVTYPNAIGDDQIWAYPQQLDTQAIMYNKDIFELAGIDTSTLYSNTSWSWDEYWDILVQVNGTEYTYNMDTYNVHATTLPGMTFGAQPYFYGHGAEMFSNDTVALKNATINEEASREGLAFLKNLTDSSVTPDWSDQGWGPLNVRFRTGEVAMINQGPWELKQNIEIEAIFDGGNNLGIMQLPHDEEGHQGAEIGGFGYAISSHVLTGSAEYYASVEFARFMSSEYAQKEGAINDYNVPSRRSVMNLTEVQSAASYPFVQPYWEAIQASMRVPMSEFWAELDAAFGSQVNEYLRNDQTLDECINNTLSYWANILPVEEDETTITTTETTTDTSTTSEPDPTNTTSSETETQTETETTTDPPGFEIPGYSLGFFFVALLATTGLLLRKKK